MMHNKPLVAAAICNTTFVFISFLFTLPIHASDRFWIDTGGGPFELTGNWSSTSGGPSGASVPTVGDNAIFNQAGSYTVTFASNFPGQAESDDLRVTAGDVTFQRTSGVGSGVYNVGVDAEITGGTFTTGTGATVINATGTLNINGGNFNARGGLHDTPGDNLNFQDGILTVTDGAFSNGNGGTYKIEGPTAAELPHLVIGAGANSFFSAISVARDKRGELTVAAGGWVDAFIIFMGLFSNSDATGTVTGPGSRWSSRIDFYVGGGSDGPGGTANLTIADQAVVDVGRLLKIWSSGMVTLDGGNIVTQTFDHTQGGTFNFVAGSLTINDGFTIGNDPAGVFPNSLTLDSDRRLSTAATTTIAANRNLTLLGGSLTTNSLQVNGNFTFLNGTLNLTGGAISGSTNLAVPTSGTLRATGDYSGLPVAGAAGSAIVASGNLTLGDSADSSGFYSNGVVDVDDYTLTVSDANDAVFDSGAAVTFGNTGTGILDAANGLTLDFGGNINGFGIVQTPDNPATPLINNGNITGASLAEPITLTGFVKGVGTCDNCNIIGTDAPGFSPATVNRGSIAYNGTLQIELGGTSDGSFDQLNHILGNGVADLGGTLEVELINGFVPSVGDTFEIISAASVVDIFAVEDLPGLGGMVWDIIYSPTNVVLEVLAGFTADFDLDGDVDGDDLIDPVDGWQARYGSDLDGGNFLDWQRQFGSGVLPLAASSTVPEPSSAALLFSLAAAGFCRCRDRK